MGYWRILLSIPKGLRLKENRKKDIPSGLSGNFSEVRFSCFPVELRNTAALRLRTLATLANTRFVCFDVSFTAESTSILTSWRTSFIKSATWCVFRSESTADSSWSKPRCFFQVAEDTSPKGVKLIGYCSFPTYTVRGW